RVEPLRGVDAELLGVAGIAQDLSQKKQLVGQIQELLTHTRMVIQNAPHGIVIVDESDGRVVYANPAFAQLFGYEPEQVVGKPMMEMLPTYEQERFRGYQEARRQGKPAPAWYQFDGLCKDSTIRRMSISVVITYTVGDTPYLLGFINPVKEG
ncbi:MAG: PAS domain-containing protein, partial [bacterium]